MKDPKHWKYTMYFKAKVLNEKKGDISYWESQSIEKV